VCKLKNLATQRYLSIAQTETLTGLSLSDTATTDMSRWLLTGTEDGHYKLKTLFQADTLETNYLRMTAGEPGSEAGLIAFKATEDTSQSWTLEPIEASN
jgi:hypothetical protein